jgi:hypothetical protein
MKLSAKALKAITTKAKTRIALAMDCSAYTVDRWIKENEEDGDLTKATVVQIISEETELTEDKILVAAKVKEA